jgi:hypothetical protein
MKGFLYFFHSFSLLFVLKSYNQFLNKKNNFSKKKIKGKYRALYSLNPAVTITKHLVKEKEYGQVHIV